MSSGATARAAPEIATHPYRMPRAQAQPARRAQCCRRRSSCRPAERAGRSRSPCWSGRSSSARQCPRRHRCTASPHATALVASHVSQTRAELDRAEPTSVQCDRRRRACRRARRPRRSRWRHESTAGKRRARGSIPAFATARSRTQLYLLQGIFKGQGPGLVKVFGCSGERQVRGALSLAEPSGG